MWIAVNKDKTELAWGGTKKPFRNFKEKRWWQVSTDFHAIPIQLPKGSIKRLIGKNMTWEDDAIFIDKLPKTK